MSLDKAIRSGKEHRKPWMGKNRSKNIDHTCRNHGSCDYCKNNRMYQTHRENQRVGEKLKEYEKEIRYGDFDNSD